MAVHIKIPSGLKKEKMVRNKFSVKLWRLAASLCFGIITTIILAPIKWNYCMGGEGYGLPFANVHPSHGELLFIKFYEMRVHALGIDLMNIIWNIFCLSTGIYLLISGYKKIKHKLK